MKPVSLPDSVQADITQILLQKCGGRSTALCRCAEGATLEARAAGAMVKALHSRQASPSPSCAQFVMAGLDPAIHENTVPSNLSD
jgi:hypothetical protein